MEAHFWFNVKCMGGGASRKSWGHKVSDCGLYGFYCMSVYGPKCHFGGISIRCLEQRISLVEGK